MFWSLVPKNVFSSLEQDFDNS